jgi:hypothetical protein
MFQAFGPIDFVLTFCELGGRRRFIYEDLEG